MTRKCRDDYLVAYYSSSFSSLIPLRSFPLDRASLAHKSVVQEKPIFDFAGKNQRENLWPIPCFLRINPEMETTSNVETGSKVARRQRVIPPRDRAEEWEQTASVSSSTFSRTSAPEKNGGTKFLRLLNHRTILTLIVISAVLDFRITSFAQVATNTNATGGVFIRSGPPLELILNSLGKACGFVVDLKVPISGFTTVTNLQEASCEEMLLLVERDVADHGYAVIRDGNKLTIISAKEAKHGEIPVIHFTKLDDIPATSNVVSCMMSAGELSRIEYVKVLRSLNLTQNLSIGGEGNSVVVSGKGIDVRRAAAVVMVMDKADSSASNVDVMRMMELKNADAGEMAELVTNLFPMKQPLPSNRVFAIGDNETKSVVVIAPTGLMPQIMEVITQLDGLKSGGQVALTKPSGQGTNDLGSDEINQLIRNLYPQIQILPPQPDVIQTDDSRPKAATGF